jgi:hypothetical protein
MSRTSSVSAGRLTGEEVGLLRRLASFGIGDALRSLGELLRTQVEGTSVRAHVASQAAIAHSLVHSASVATMPPYAPVLRPAPVGERSSPRLEGPREFGFAAHFTVDGGARLRQLIHFTPDGARLLSGLMVGTAHREGTELSLSSLAEACNIIVSSFVGGVAAAAGLQLVPSVPHVESGPLPEVARIAFAGIEEALLLVSDLRLPGVRWAGRIVTAPEPDSLARLLELARSEAAQGAWATASARK